VIAFYTWDLALADELNHPLLFRPSPNQIARAQDVVNLVDVVEAIQRCPERFVIAVYVGYDSNLHIPNPKFARICAYYTPKQLKMRPILSGG
jgi:hypothetical protein